MAHRNVYLKVVRIPGYNPVNPPTMLPHQYKRDCMRNEGHEDGTIPQAEVNERMLDAQRYIELKILSRGTNSITVQKPPDEFVAPAGYYMLVILTPSVCLPDEEHDCGPVPSIGKWVRLTQ